jgi:hypothetical protein
MPKKKAAPKKKSAPKKKTAPKKKSAPKKKLIAKKTAKPAKPAKPAPKKKPAPQKKSSFGARREPQAVTRPVVTGGRRGLGPESGGQSGDTEGLSRKEVADSESVEELSEEGQDFEAEAVSGVEHALDPDEGEVTTSEVPEDDVPEEYLDPDQS